jgi:LysM repeat protein
MASRSPARWVAPIALAGAVAAILVTISASQSGSSSTTSSASTPARSTSTTGSTTTTGTTRTTAGGVSHRYYVVKTGDVLSGIASSTGVPLARIEQLNPAVDAQSLHAGQKIKLAP